MGFNLKSPLLDNVFGYPKLLHVQREYNWEIMLPDLWLPVTGMILGRFCQSINFGQYNISEIVEMKSGFWKDHFPSISSIDKLICTFVCPVPDLVGIYFQGWKNLIIDQQGFYSPSSKYKKNIYIILSDSSGIPSNIITAKQAFPTSFPAYKLNYEGSTFLKYEITFQIDRLFLGTAAAGNLLSSVSGAVGDFAKGVASSVTSIF